MRGGIVYFSGTGNTEYVVMKIKSEFERNNVQCSLIDVSKKRSIRDGDYDFFVFASPIYCEVFPEYYVNFIKNNIKEGRGRRCMIISTQASEFAAGVNSFGRLISGLGFKVIIQDGIEMPNNYYVVAFKKTDDSIAGKLKEKADVKTKEMVIKFLNNKSHIRKTTLLRELGGKAVYGIFNRWSLKWPKRTLDVDYELCVKCMKCVKNCPTLNIKFREGFTFGNKCISCQRCMHGCPTNAFLYKGRHFEQYKL